MLQDPSSTPSPPYLFEIKRRNKLFTKKKSSWVSTSTKPYRMRSSGTSGVTKKAKEKTPRSSNSKVVSSLHGKIHNRNTSLGTAIFNDRVQPQPQNSVVHQNLIDKLKRMEENMERRNSEAGLVLQNKSLIAGSGTTKPPYSNNNCYVDMSENLMQMSGEAREESAFLKEKYNYANLQKRAGSLDYTSAHNQLIRGIENYTNNNSHPSKVQGHNLSAAKMTTPRDYYISARRNSSNVCEIQINMNSKQESGDLSNRKKSPTNPLSHRVNLNNTANSQRNKAEVSSRSPSSPYFNMSRILSSSPKTSFNNLCESQKENLIESNYINKVEKGLRNNDQPVPPSKNKTQLTENKNILNQSSRVEKSKQIYLVNTSKSGSRKENTLGENDSINSSSKLKSKHSLNSFSQIDKDSYALAQKDSCPKFENKGQALKSNSKKYIKFMKNMLNTNIIPVDDKMSNSLRKNSSRLGDTMLNSNYLIPKGNEADTQRDRIPISVRIYPCSSYLNSFIKQTNGADGSKSRVEVDGNSILSSEPQELFVKRDSSFKKIDNSVSINSIVSTGKNRDESHNLSHVNRNNSTKHTDNYSASKLDAQNFSPLNEKDELLVRREINREDLVSARAVKQSEQILSEFKGRARGNSSHRIQENSSSYAGNYKKRSNISNNLHQNLFEKLRRIEENIGMVRKSSIGGGSSKVQNTKGNNSKTIKGKKKEPQAYEEGSSGTTHSQRRTCSYDYTNFMKNFDKNTAGSSNRSKEDNCNSPKDIYANNPSSCYINEAYNSIRSNESQSGALHAEVIQSCLKKRVEASIENKRDNTLNASRGVSPRCSGSVSQQASKSRNKDQKQISARKESGRRGDARIDESRGKYIKSVLDRKHSEQQQKEKSELLFIGDGSIDECSGLSFQKEARQQIQKRQEAGFVVKNGYKSQRGNSIDYCAVQEGVDIKELLANNMYKEKEDFYYTNKERNFNERFRKPNEATEEFKFDVRTNSPEIPITSARFPSMKEELYEGEIQSSKKTSARNTREEILKKLLHSKRDLKSISESKKTGLNNGENSNRVGGRPSVKNEYSMEFQDKKEKLNSLYMQLKKLEEKKVFSPLTEKKSRAPLEDNSTRKFIEKNLENSQSKGYPLSMEDIYNARASNQQGVKTPIKRHEEMKYQLHLKTDAKCYNNQAANVCSISNASVNLVEELENNRKGSLTPKLEEKYGHSRKISAEDSISHKKLPENPKNKELLNINCKSDFNLNGLCKMDSIFDTQNDIRNVSHMREKLINMIKTYQKEEHQAPPTSLDFYKLIKLIGKGAFGKVHLAMNVLTEKYVAIKCIGKTHMNDRSSKKKIFNEITILKNINHPNIIRLLEVFSNHKYIFLVMEYAPQGDLLKYVKKRGKLEEKEARVFLRDITLALKECHEQSILHRDIKLDNILLTDTHQLKLCDFGVSRYAKKGQLINEQCGTPAYIAPEIISVGGYEGCQADLWSLGVVLYAMITGTIPFKGKNIEEMNHLILKGDYTIPDWVSPDSADLIKKLLVKIPEQRLTAVEVLKHPYLRDIVHPSLFSEKKLGFPSTDHFFIEKIDSRILKQLEEYGFDKESVVLSLVNSIPNHATACYHLLKEV